MTQEEKDLALRIFEKAMENSENLSNSAQLATLSVNAAMSVYAAIKVQEDEEILAEEIAYREREASLEEARKVRQKQMAEARKNADYYLIYYKKSDPYGTEWLSLRIHQTTRPADVFLKEHFDTFYKYLEVGVRKISREDAEHLLTHYRKSNGASKQLKCESVKDFVSCVSDCKTSGFVDMTGLPIETALIF